MSKIKYFDDGNVLSPYTKVEVISDENGTPLKELLDSAGGEDRANNVPRIDITSSRITADDVNNTLYPLTTEKNPVPEDNEFHDDTTLTFVGKGMSFTDKVIIAYQGQATLGNPKKGFSIDLKHKHKFGDWLEFDSFHLKGFYQDWEHIRDTTCNRLYEQILRTHAIDSVRPYMSYNDFNNDIRQRIDAGAFCHVDGFPCELYINGKFWGLYTWRLKKDKDLYQMEKENHNHIMIDPNWINENFASFPWAKTEIRYPKKLKNMDGTAYDSDDPKEIAESDCKNNILSFFNALFVNPSSLTKDDFGDVLNFKSVIDLICHHDFCCVWDSFIKNTLYCTWDGVHWSLCPYDMDNCFGIGVHNHTTWVPTMYAYNYDFTTYQARELPWYNKFVSLYSDDIKSRYAELRRLGVFSTSNVIGIMQEWISSVGFKLYKKDTSRWDYPTNGGNYPGAFKDSLLRVKNYIDARLPYLDNKYGYSE